MALQIQIFDAPMQVSANAGANGINQYCAVTQDTAGNPLDMIYPASASVVTVGINQTAGAVIPPGSTTVPAAPIGQAIDVRVLGITKATAAAAITVGQLVSISGAVGQLGPAAAPAATDTYVVGMALTAAGAAGDIFTLLLLPGLTTQVNV